MPRGDKKTISTVIRFNATTPAYELEEMIETAHAKLRGKAKTALKETPTLTPTLDWFYTEHYVIGETCFLVLTGEVRRRKK